MWHVLNNWSILGPLFDFHGYSFWNTSHIPVYPDHVHHIGCISIQAGCSFWFVWIFSKDSRKGTGCGLFSEVLRKPSEIFPQTFATFTLKVWKCIWCTTLYKNIEEFHPWHFRASSFAHEHLSEDNTHRIDTKRATFWKANLWMKSMLFATKKPKKRWMDGFQVHPRLITTLYRGPLRIGLFPLQNGLSMAEKNGGSFPPLKKVFFVNRQRNLLSSGLQNLDSSCWGHPRKSQESVSFWQARCQKHQKRSKREFWRDPLYHIGMYLSIY